MLLTHALYVASVLALAGAGLRVASVAVPGGVERILAALVLATAAAVAESLLLGLVGAAKGVPLALAAGATYVVTLSALPAGRPVAEELRAWWNVAQRGSRAAVGALGGVGAGFALWNLQHPHVGTDGFTYHLPLAGGWAQDGRPGGVFDVITGIPVANYPVTNEVVLSWQLAIADSFTPSSVWTVALWVAWLAGTWVVLRELEVPGRVRTVALAGLGALPVAATQLGGPFTDVPAAAWMAVTAALCAVSPRHPRALPIAVVGAGLAFGTKTTPALLLAVALGWAFWQVRGRNDMLRPLVAGAGLAVVVGGLWALRNLIDHGSPLWPLVSTSFGDPVPPAFAEIDDTFLSHPRAMLNGRVSDYAQVLGGGFLLLPALLLVPLVARTRTVLALTGVALLAVFTWMNAPYTGISDDDALAVGAVRYLLPAMTVATVALAVAARDAGRLGRLLVLVVLWTALFLSVGRDRELGFPLMPSIATLALCALLGAGVAVVALRVPWRVAGRAVAVAAAVVLAFHANGYLERHAESGLADAELVRALIADEEFKDGSAPIAMGPATVGVLRGDGLDHEIPFLGTDTDCDGVRRALDGGWVVLQRAPRTTEYDRLRACISGRPVHRDATYELFE